MQKQLIHIHGGTSWPSNDAFISALKQKELSNPSEEYGKSWSHGYSDALGEDWQIIRPSMPGADNAQYDAWKIWFEKHFQFLQDGVVLVGHSLGGTFLLKYLSENTLTVKIEQVHFVAAACEDGEYGEVIFKLGNDYSNIEAQCSDIFVYHSKDDFVVPYAEGEQIAKMLPQARLVTFTDRGHFLQAEFPELIANITTL